MMVDGDREHTEHDGRRDRKDRVADVANPNIVLVCGGRAAAATSL